MISIAVYDPPMCCSSGVCGPDVDPVLPRFAGLLAQLQSRGFVVERFNLAQQPMAFAQKTEVRALLEGEGVEILPLIFINGDIVAKRHYPDAAEMEVFIQSFNDRKPIAE